MILRAQDLLWAYRKEKVGSSARQRSIVKVHFSSKSLLRNKQQKRYLRQIRTLWPTQLITILLALTRILSFRENQVPYQRSHAPIPLLKVWNQRGIWILRIWEFNQHLKEGKIKVSKVWRDNKALLTRLNQENIS